MQCPILLVFLPYTLYLRYRKHVDNIINNIINKEYEAENVVVKKA